MMWDFGNGQHYQPDGDPNRQPYPPSQPGPTPFQPLGMPSTPSFSSGSLSNPYAQPYPASPAPATAHVPPHPPPPGLTPGASSGASPYGAPTPGSQMNEFPGFAPPQQQMQQQQARAPGGYLAPPTSHARPHSAPDVRPPKHAHAHGALNAPSSVQHHTSHHHVVQYTTSSATTQHAHSGASSTASDLVASALKAGAERLRRPKRPSRSDGAVPTISVVKPSSARPHSQGPAPARPAAAASAAARPASSGHAYGQVRPVSAHQGHAHAAPSSGQALAHGHRPADVAFKYSACTGRKRALCVGINYAGQPHALFGCVNDAKNVRRFLMKHHGFRAEDIVLLTDDARDARSKPTRQNIVDGMRWLVKGARADDSLFFHYSGHGGQTKDKDGDEIDGFDEVVFPLDYKTAGHLVDDDMHALMVHPLPTGCRLTALFDSCHSGSVLDLPFVYHSDGRLKGEQVRSKFRAARASPADVVSWSGCKDSQTSADTYEDGVAVGAMSYAFMLSMTEDPGQTYQGLLRSVRKILKEKYAQKPQLSSSHRIDTSLRFVI